MNNRVEQAVFWPNVTVDVVRRRHGCTTCIPDVPSQPAGTPVAPPSPEYPFQMVVAYYFFLQGKNYLVVGDQYSGWLSIYGADKGDFNGKALERILWENFTTFYIPRRFQQTEALR